MQSIYKKRNLKNFKHKSKSCCSIATNNIYHIKPGNDGKKLTQKKIPN